MNLNLLEIPAIYINLQHDVEKNKSIVDVLDKCGFKNIIKVEGKYIPKSPRAGCSYSHYKALNVVDPPFLIFEDDCKVKNFQPYIEVPNNADAVYLGISSWGRMNSHSGPCVQYKRLENGLLRIYNMLSAHSVLYLNKEYSSLCSKISKHAFETSQYQDIGFAEIQRYYDIYAFDDPLFSQTSSIGTNKPLTSYPTFEILKNKRKYREYWYPTNLH